MFPSLTLPLIWSWQQVFVTTYTLITLGLIVRILYHQRKIGVTLAWILILLMFPLIGIFGYLIIGEPKLGTRREKRAREINQFYEEFSNQYLIDLNNNESRLFARYSRLSRIAARATGFVPTDGNKIDLFSDSNEAFQAIMHDMREAKHSCLLEFYIIEPSGCIEEIFQCLLETARRGVKCQLLADAVGSRSFLKSPWRQKLEEAGVSVHVSLGVGLLKTFFVRSDLRNHRKIVVIDHAIAYTGSLNLCDPFCFKKDSGVGEWVDVMIRCHGPSAQALAAVLYADIAAEDDAAFKEIRQVLTTYAQHQEQYPVVIPDAGLVEAQAAVQVIPSAPDQESYVIYETIICALHLATHHIVITTPYFIPDEPLLLALTTAAKRGVEVTLIMPDKNDSILVRWASRAYYRVLLDAGVKLALFEGGLLHSKTLTIDDEFTLFGTVNMDMRSFYLNLEVSLAIYDREITQQVYHQQMRYLAQAAYIQPERWQNRGHWWALLENSVRLLSPLL